MFTKTAIALTIIVGIVSGALAAPKPKQSGTPNWGAYDCPGAYVGSNPRTLINRPQNGLCDNVEE
jgi:hypothetical protein